jgi:hypothetical protein
LSRCKKLKSLALSEEVLAAIYQLGVNGMSSEQSEGEVGSQTRRYYIKTIPWRSSELTRWLHHLDSLPKNLRSNSSRQYKQRNRLESPLFSESRTPPNRLPISFFCQAWLTRAVDALSSLEISKEVRLPELPYSAILSNVKQVD